MFPDRSDPKIGRKFVDTRAHLHDFVQVGPGLLVMVFSHGIMDHSHDGIGSGLVGRFQVGSVEQLLSRRAD